MDQEKNPTLEKLIEHEACIASLYSRYAEKLQYFSDFWKRLAEEEVSHAEWIRTLYAKKKVGLVDFFDRKFPLDAVAMSVDFINQKIGETEKDITPLMALENAVHIENGMLEHRVFEVFPEDSMELKIILEALRLSTQEHLKMVKKMWLKESGQMNEELERRTE